MIDHIGEKKLIICITNAGYEASLEQWKIYQTLTDDDAAKHQEIRVIDDEGEDYLYPAACFSSILLEDKVAQTFINQHAINRDVA